MYVLNFYSPVFVDQLKRGRKTATIRLGDKSMKYRRGQLVWITVGYRHEPREKVFTAVIDDVEVKRVRELSPRDIEHDNPEFRRVEDTIHFLEQIYGREIGTDDIVTVIRFSQVIESTAQREGPPGNGHGPRRRAPLGRAGRKSPSQRRLWALQFGTLAARVPNGSPRPGAWQRPASSARAAHDNHEKLAFQEVCV